MAIRTPSEIYLYMSHSGNEKARMTILQLSLSAILGGMFISLGTLLGMEVAGLSATSLGFTKFLFGALFPMGFIAITITGADLFTSDCAYGFLAWRQREINAGLLIRYWVLAWVFNFVGALLTAWLFGLQTHLLTNDGATQFLISIATGKVSHTFWVTFVKGILANMMVCTAVILGLSAKEDAFGRIFGIWLMVMAFVVMGMEHSIANMFIIPAAMMAGANITIGQFVFNNLIPATLGNIVGGVLLIAWPYALIHLSKGKSALLKSGTTSKPVA